VSIKKYYFLQWEFDSEQDTIKHVDELTCQKLEPQISAFLCLLIENQNQVFSKEQISKALWPNTVVEENSVYQVLTKLRRILNDPPKQSIIIKTFPKKGYRFIAELRQASQITLVTSEWKNKGPAHYNYTVLLVLSLLFGFSAIAYFSSKPEQVTTVNYAHIELTTELGLESWPAPNHQDGSLLYVKDAHQLWMKKTDKPAVLLLQSENKLFYPAWSVAGDKFALWILQNNSCLLSIRTPLGDEISASSPVACDYVERITWLNDNQLIALYRQKGQYKPFQYELSADRFTEIPLLLQPGERLKTVVKAWHDNIYYVVINDEYKSRLIDSKGISVMQWSHPIKFAAFDSYNQRLIVNDETKHLGLASIGIEGDKQYIAQTAKGVFSAINTDADGGIYATVESWQVNIRDKDNLPIFSSTSLDYLPVSNVLGETAFMSRRGGFCQIYLHNNGEVAQLSRFDNYDTVKFVQWSPDLSLILTNRDDSAYIYNRKGLTQSFPLVTNNLPVSFGWLSNNKIYSFDGEYIRYYSINGEKIAEFKVIANYLFYQADEKAWWVFQQGQLFVVKGELLNMEKITSQLTLTEQQASKIVDVRILADTMYWKSRHLHQDFIWQYKIKSQMPVELVKSGRFIWNYDVNADSELTVAVKENIEGNIYLYTQSE
jgi:DNA-binding winged helix-turn-helix (wHTH) protein